MTLKKGLKKIILIMLKLSLGFSYFELNNKII